MLVVAIAALREPDGHVSAARSQNPSSSKVAKQTHPSPSAGKSPTAGRSSSGASSGASSGNAPDSAVKDVPLIVLNNTTIPHLAEQAAHRFEQGGWTVSSFGNYQNDILSTCAYYDPAEPNAKAAAEALKAQYPTIKRVKERFPQLPAGPVVVVLTPDYSAT